MYPCLATNPNEAAGKRKGALTARGHLAEKRAALGLLEHGREEGRVVRRNLVLGRSHYRGDVLRRQYGAYAHRSRGTWLDVWWLGGLVACMAVERSPTMFLPRPSKRG